MPDTLELTTDRIPHWAPWVRGYEYFFRAKWIVDGDGAAGQRSFSLDIKPGRDGSLSYEKLEEGGPRGSGARVPGWRWPMSPVVAGA